MSIAFCFTPSFSSSSSNLIASSSSSFPSSFPSSSSLHLRLALPSPPLAASSLFHHRRGLPFVLYSGGGGGGGIGGGFSSGGGGGEDEDGNAGDDNYKNEALLVLAEAGRSLECMPKELAKAIKDGRIHASVVSRFLELEKSPFLRWLLQFGGFKERLLADDLFLFKVCMECGVGVFTKVCVFCV